ncbi:hypothetical protein GC209_07695 [bacterium]|nr:hypothetical protein [bacterium]
MLDEIFVTMRAFVALFQRGGRLPWTILMPLLVMGFSWPLLRVVLPSEREAFMFAFMLAMGLRFVLAADSTIQRLQSQISGRTALIILLLLGPGVLGLLIYFGEPIWCQRFLSLYFLIYACLYLLDVVDGRHAMVRYFLSGEGPKGSEAMMGRVMAIFYLTLVLLNETLIRQTSLSVWLIYFGLLPILSCRVQLALVRTVEAAHANGFGRF